MIPSKLLFFNKNKFLHIVTYLIIILILVIVILIVDTPTGDCDH